ncbi:glycoside hydrolase family 125 protein [Companilactobacillus hulinensis]|uniref:glycoside hydrolase family 125 protein n=1 Tax=Companilactobacillus hulinensis TaxID=2486007 RepID=UPI000F786095|nr:glycoside hydrolase family 125 protein [Companilactobacillus hulinensis]
MIDQKKLIEQITNYSKTVKLDSEKETRLFRNCLVDTIEHTVTVEKDGSVFVATGDIPAMWLRDSTFQVLPYLEISEKIPELKEFVAGVIKKQLFYVQIDPYSNAFNQSESGAHWTEDASNIPIPDWVWERKFEVDSLCAPIHLAYELYKTGYTAHLTDEFYKVAGIIVDTFIKEQHHEKSDYFFNRTDCPPSDTLTHDGKGSPVSYTGMIWSGFRPSDDACKYGYLIPANMYAVVILNELKDMLGQYDQAAELLDKVQNLVLEIQKGIDDYGIVEKDGKKIFAYEVDGLGNYNLMDDANVPSLLSATFLGYCDVEDDVYLNTRKFILSSDNPYYYSGKVFSGIGSAHTPERYVWPISKCMEGLTSNDVDAIKADIKLVSQIDDDTMQCHEGVNVDDVSQYTREWFSWANMTFCQLVFHYLRLTYKI